MKYKNISFWFGIIVLLMSTVACKQASDLKAFTEANYKLQGIKDLRLNGIDVTGKRSYFDFKTAEGDSLLNAFTTNNLKATTTLYLEVQMQDPEVARTMEITDLEWQLLIDGKETLTGNVMQPLTLQNGENELPVRTTVTLAEVEGIQNYEGFSMLTTLISQGKDASNRLVLRIKPTIKTPVGNITVPDYINVSQPAGS
ncbi:hypothetical protein WG947_08735 [Pontibacter sp. H259]|uniref:hypothetical protein n=1 Tax=Pontibacter sp. H259 TaxID=3133421 RepID=UPI0030BF76A3